jgi:ABC-type glycerol-3-phosphate transport system permease component
MEKRTDSAAVRGQPAAAPTALAVRLAYRLRAGAADALVLATLGVVWLFMLYPAVWIFYGSLQANETLFSGRLVGFTLDNYAKIFSSGFRVFLLNSLVISTAAVLISTFVSVLAAYAFPRKQFRLRRLLFSSALAGQVFPWIILVTPLFILFARLGLPEFLRGDHLLLFGHRHPLLGVPVGGLPGDHSPQSG